MNKYVDAALAYARAVLAGEVVACKWVKLACQRQLDDLARAPSNEWPWEVDLDRAARPCMFIELLPHIKGKWAREGRTIELEAWQCFVITTVFGGLSDHRPALRIALSVAATSKLPPAPGGVPM